jgi:S1-C subfamily serine protease
VPKLVEKLNDAIKKNKNHEEITPPRIGVILAPEKIARELGVNQGVLVLEVSPGTPADKAGLRPSRQNFRTGKPQLGDVILAIEGEKVNSQKDVVSVLEKYKPGDTVTLKILRDTDESEVKVILASLR